MAAKKVAAGVKAAWEAAKKDFSEGTHTELLKQDVKDVIEFAKSKASKVPSTTNSKAVTVNNKIEPRVNPDAGAELLSHFKDQWAEIHKSTEEASKMGTKVYVDLQELNSSITKSHVIINRCREEFSHLRDIVEALDEAGSKVESIGQLMRQVEQDIQSYCQSKAELTNERRKHSLYTQHQREVLENRSQVEQLRKVLQNEQQLALDLKHEIENKELKERQNAFQEIFNKQMADYRKRGEVDHPIEEIKGRGEAQLEEMIIEDEDGTASLHEFLSDVVLEDVPEDALPNKPHDSVGIPLDIPTESHGPEDTPTESLSEKTPVLDP